MSAAVSAPTEVDTARAAKPLRLATVVSTTEIRSLVTSDALTPSLRKTKASTRTDPTNKSKPTATGVSRSRASPRVPS